MTQPHSRIIVPTRPRIIVPGVPLLVRRESRIIPAQLGGHRHARRVINRQAQTGAVKWGIGPGGGGGGGGGHWDFTTEPVFDSNTDTMVFQENFDWATSISDLVNATGPHLTPVDGMVNPWADPNASLITGASGAGKALRFTYVGTDQEGHQCDAFVTQSHLLQFDTANGSNPCNILVIKNKRRVLVNGGLSAVAELPLKYMMAFIGAGDTRVQFNTHDHLPNADLWAKGVLWEVICNSEIDTNSMQPRTTGPFLADLSNAGNWWDETFVLRPHFSAGQLDGRAQMWVNGTLIIDACMANAGVIPSNAAGGTQPWTTTGDMQDMFRDGDSGPYVTNFTRFAWWSDFTANNSGFTVDLDNVDMFTRPS